MAGQRQSKRPVTGAAARSTVKFLHTADWQLGMTRHFLDADAQPRYTGARIDAIADIGRVARAQDCEFVVVCGDVFESNAVSARIVSRSLEQLRGIDLPVYLLPGNHDPLDAASVYTSATFTSSLPANVTVMTGTGPHPVRPGVEIIAAPWFSKHPLADLVAEAVAELPADGTLRIVAGHGAVDIFSPDSANPALIRLETVERALRDGRVHYVALGDRHSVTSVAGTGRIWYSGTQEVTDFDETDPGKVLVVEVSPGEVSVVPHRVGGWSFRDLVFTVDGLHDVQHLQDVLTAIPAKDRTVLRLSLTGTLSLAAKAALDDALDEQRLVFAGIEIRDLHTDLAVVVDSGELTDLGVGGFAQDAALELAGRASGDGPDADAARDALSLLYRLAGGRP